MDLDWKDMVPRVIALGAPVLGGALGGPFGAAAGRILAEALNAPEATPSAVRERLSARGVDPNIAAEAAQRAESEWLAALAEIGKAQVAEVGETQRAEIVSEDRLQRWWRPIYALELTMVECPGFALTLLHALWIGHEAAINGFASLSALLMTYFAARFGVLGVYVNGRSREKQALASGELPASWVNQLTRALKKK